MSSASGVVGPLAPSITILALILPALALVIWPSSAAGIRMSHSQAQKSAALVMASPPLKPATPPVLATCSSSLGTARPLSLATPPVWSCTATTSAPASANSLPAMPPTLPKPCGHARALDRQADLLGRLAGHGEHAAPGGLAPAQRAAHVHRLAGDHAGGGGAHVHE
jgi:hypothetical protein